MRNHFHSSLYAIRRRQIAERRPQIADRGRLLSAADGRRLAAEDRPQHQNTMAPRPQGRIPVKNGGFLKVRMSIKMGTVYAIRNSQAAADHWLLAAEDRLQHQNTMAPRPQGRIPVKNGGFLKVRMSIKMGTVYAIRNSQAAADHWLLAAEDRLQHQSSKGPRLHSTLTEPLSKKGVSKSQGVNNYGYNIRDPQIADRRSQIAECGCR